MSVCLCVSFILFHFFHLSIRSLLEQHSHVVFYVSYKPHVCMCMCMCMEFVLSLHKNDLRGVFLFPLKPNNYLFVRCCKFNLLIKKFPFYYYCSFIYFSHLTFNVDTASVCMYIVCESYVNLILKALFPTLQL